MRTVSGQMTSLTSSENYLSTKAAELKSVANLNRTIREQIAFVANDPTLSVLTRSNDAEVYVALAVFGAAPCVTKNLGIDTRPFGHGIGLIVDNYTIQDRNGQPEQFEIKVSP